MEARDWGRRARRRRAAYSPSSLEVDVLDSEFVVRRSRAIVHRLVPRPSSPFVEHNVARRAHMLCLRVEDAVGLRALRVADEHSRSAPVVELADVAKLLGELRQPKTRKWETTGLHPCQASYGVLLSSALVGERLRM